MPHKLAALQAAPCACVPNEKSGTLSVIDTADRSVVATIPGGKRPLGELPGGVGIR